MLSLRDEPRERTGAVVGKSIDKAFEESCRRPKAPRGHNVPCFSPWLTLDSSTPLDGNAKRHEARGFSKPSKNIRMMLTATATMFTWL